MYAAVWQPSSAVMVLFTSTTAVVLRQRERQPGARRGRHGGQLRLRARGQRVLGWAVLAARAQLAQLGHRVAVHRLEHRDAAHDGGGVEHAPLQLPHHHPLVVLGRRLARKVARRVAPQAVGLHAARARRHRVRLAPLARLDLELDAAGGVRNSPLR
jgi:hypothetical protein